MGHPEERREEDELVEPLFAGLRSADSPGERESEPDDSPPPDPWKHPPRPLPSLAVAPDVDAEPSTARLFVKALVLLIVLIAIAAGYYLVFGV